MTSKPKFHRQIAALLRQHLALVIAVITVSLLGSLTEGLSIGLVIPLLEDPQSQGSFFQSLPFLGDFSRRAADMTVIDRVRLAAIILVVVVVLRSSLSYLGQLLVLRLQVTLERELVKKTLRQLFSVSVLFIARHAAGDLLAIVAGHTRTTATLVSSLVGAVANISLLGVYAVLMLAISWQLTVAAAALLVLLTIINRIANASRLKQAGEAQRKYLHKLRRATVESVSMMKLFHIFAQEKRMISRFERILEDFLSHYREGQRLIFRTTPLFNVSAIAGLSLLLLAGTYLLPSQTEFWLERTVLFLLIVFRLMGPAASLNRTAALVTNSYPSVEEVYGFLEREGKPYLKNGTIRFRKLEQALRLEDVSFRYEADEAPVLSNLSFEIPRGKMTAIVGPSGAGKSTIVSLLARLFDCSEGRITIDGTDLRDLDVNSWRARIALVSQDTLLLNDSVAANLTLARPEATEAEVSRAARLAQIEDFVTALPQGYETRIGDRGVRLSGGQQQRLSIARALLANPELLILDEATSDLDSETERAIQAAIDAFSEDRTVVVVAHRLSTIRNADNIVVIRGGRVAEQGTHSALLQADGLYAQLVKSQDLESQVLG